MKLSPAPPPGYLYIEDSLDAGGNVVAGIATRLGISVSTYRKWRLAGKGPDTFRITKKVMARESAVEEWLAEQERAALAPKREMRPPEPRIQHRTPKAA